MSGEINYSLGKKGNNYSISINLGGGTAYVLVKPYHMNGFKVAVA